MKSLKTIIVCLCLIITVCSVWYALRLRKKLDALPDQSAYASKKDSVQLEAQIIARAVDKEGLQHAIVKATENIIPAGEGNNGKVALSKGVQDTTAMAIAKAEIKEKQLENLTIVNSSLTAENLKLKAELGKDKRPVLVFRDKYLDATVHPGNPADTTDKGSLDLKYNADLNLVQYWKRKWFLGSKISYLDIYSNDPRTTVNGVKRLVYQQRQPVFGLRIQAAGNINPQTGSYGFGPAARIDLGRLSIQGNYTWYPESDRWRPSINANYDLIRF